MMARKNKRARKTKAKVDPVARFVRPTEAREAHNDFQSAGPAVKVIPPIDTLLKREIITHRQHYALERYADVAHAANRSPNRDSCDFSIYGGGEGLPHFGVRMNIELGRLERALGSLRDIAYAVCVENVSPAQWAMQRHGSVMRERKAEGRKIVRWYEPKRMQHRIAIIEIGEAADRLAKEIGA